MDPAAGRPQVTADDDEAAVTAAQVRDVVARIIGAGQHRPGDDDILLVFDAGYDLARLSFLLADLPVQVLGRLRSDRVMGRTPPPRPPGTNGLPPSMAAPSDSKTPQAGAPRMSSRSPERPGGARPRRWPSTRCIPG